jgi:hypothetical protein
MDNHDEWTEEERQARMELRAIVGGGSQKESGA